MTYFDFLLRFLVVPILVLLAVARWDATRGRRLPVLLRGYPSWLPLGAHALIALIYTTPWDNYLVATRVWWYQPGLVTGVVIGYVPLEEYCFFILQPLLTGLWVLFLARRLPAREASVAHPGRLRVISAAVVGVVWLVSVAQVIGGGAGTYLGLLLAWALPPVIAQLAFGADILWKYRRLLALVIIPATLYLCLADALAIDGGTWTINPAQSFNLFLGGLLPVEEAVFFLMTSVLIALGVVLMLARESRERLPPGLRRRLEREPSTKTGIKVTERA